MKRSKFNLSHTQLHTGSMGWLIPVGVLEVLPGDTIQHAAQTLIRVAPLATPPMHPVRIDVRHFFVPNRLVWDDWEDFITGGPDGMNASVPPYMTHVPAVGSVLDHMGVSPSITPGVEYSALPVRAFNLIYREFYRDQDVGFNPTISTASGLDTTTYIDGFRANWEKDYFTTARPFEQKGPDVTLPLGTSATGTGTATITQGGQLPTVFPLVRGEADTAGQASVDLQTGTITVGQPISLTGTVDVDVDLTTATAATVNELRLALALQRYAEARARYGSRYTEYLAYLGVRSADSRLQRPEYLGGGRTNVQFSEVMSTAVSQDAVGTTVALPGNFGGHGIGANRTNRYRRFFQEHGFVISILSVVPQTMYPDGLFRHWSRKTRNDYFQRELQHIGQQTVLNSEVTAGHDSPSGIFGYQDRYDEYRRSESQVHGKFRAGQYLSDWHFARDLPSNVALNSQFVSAFVSDAPFQLKEIEPGVPAENIYIACKHQIVARRLLASKGSSFIL